MGHFGNKHPPQRPTTNPPKLILGQKDKQTAPSRLAKSDHDSQSHGPQPGGHWKGTGSGYSRCEHHSEILKHHRGK